MESWNGPEDTDLQPSQFAKAVTKVHCLTVIVVNNVIIWLHISTCMWLFKGFCHDLSKLSSRVAR